MTESSRTRTSHDLDIESRAITSRMENVTHSLRRGGLTRAEHAHLVQELDALRVALMRNSGHFEVAHENNPKLSVLVQKWAKETNASPATASEWTRAFNKLIAVAGDVPVRGVTKAHVRELKGKLKRASIRKALSGLKSVFNWSVEQGLIESSPCDGVTKLPRATSVEDDERGRVPFTAADMRIVFSQASLDYLKAPVRKEDVRRGVEPSEPWRGGRGWIPYLLAFTGMRLAEATGLRKQDVRQDEDTGVWYFDIVNHPPDASRRSPQSDASPFTMR